MTRQADKKNAGAPGDPPFRRLMRRSPAEAGQGVRGAWRRHLFTALLAFAVAFGVIALGIAHRKRSAELALQKAPMDGESPPAGTTTDAAADGSIEIPLTPLSPYALADKRGFVKAIQLQPFYEPIDATSFKSGEVTIVLTGIDAPSKAAICEDFERKMWICGMMARVALYNLIRLDKVNCLPRQKGSKPGEGAVLLHARCEVRGKDLAIELIRTGFARPAGLSDREMLEAEQEARSARRGLWDGDWKIVQGARPPDIMSVIEQLPQVRPSGGTKPKNAHR
mgnify:CR=1 FL=1